MTVITKIYEDDKITIKVEEKPEGYFSFSLITSDSVTSIYKDELEENEASDYFKNAVRSYITSENF